MNLLQYSNFYLVGIKGVAMTSLAQCLLDAEKQVRGSDLAQDFVTQDLLKKHQIKIDLGFEGALPENTECVIYTSAHQGPENPQVKAALAKGLPTFSQAEAIAWFFNQKKGLAVCGVGGKSTVSAMITWILEKVGRQPSFSVGVGNISGLDKTGSWSENSRYFVVEADEYVIDPAAPARGEEIIPRFSFLNPGLIVCTNLEFDHPDVYRDLAHTKEIYNQFFHKLPPDGILVYNQDNQDLLELIDQQRNIIGSQQLIGFGESAKAQFRLTDYQAKEGETTGTVQYQGEKYQLKLKIPGKFNLLNAVAAIAACTAISVPIEDSVQALQTFASTSRRFEFKGEKNGVKYYDDYAHHPHEVFQAIKALNEWYPKQRKLIAFQSHTFSRTKELFTEFVAAFGESQEVVMIDVFASAREKFDPTVSSDKLCEAIQAKHPQVKAQNLKTIENLAKYFKTELKPGDVGLTLGAGDIYEVFELLE